MLPPRDPTRLAGRRFDVVVVGAGIHGACAAWEASRRGLAVALIDRADVGAATSAQSLKVIHGGLRYLQHGDLPRVRASAAELGLLRRLAPHLVRPLPVVVPTGGALAESPLAFRAALALYDALGGRASHPGPGSGLPAPGILRREAAPGLFGRGALWYDAQVTHPERLTLDFVLAASERGAEVCTYLEAAALRTEAGRVTGVEAVDVESGRSVAIAAAAVLDATGPWAGRLAPLPGLPALALGINVVLARDLVRTAVGFRSRRDAGRDPVGGGRRFLFVAPWQGRTLLGTSYRVHDPREPVAPGPAEWGDLLEDAREALPGLPLRDEEVVHVHAGLLPLHPGTAVPRLADRPLLVDHAASGGPEGLLTLIGVKYTTARAAAERAVLRLLRRLGRDGAVTGGSGTLGHDGTAAAAPAEPGAARLHALHGVRWRQAAQGTDWETPVAPGSAVLRGEVRHAVRAEMAIHLDDVVLRRTDLGTRGVPGATELAAVADLVAGELGWGLDRRAAELARVEAAYRPLRRSGRD
jgi:glycerol-3-phosphate dehydrogenase